MAKYIIDFDKGTIEEYKGETVTFPKGYELLDMMKPYLGTREYDGIVDTIQRWYYGSLVKAPWCATCLSYFLNGIGVNIKSENVFTLMTKAEQSGVGKLYWPNEMTPQKGDILFLLTDGSKTMTTTSGKHVTVCQEIVSGNTFIGRGGNQGDALKDSEFKRSTIYRIWRL